MPKAKRFVPLTILHCAISADRTPKVVHLGLPFARYLVRKWSKAHAISWLITFLRPCHFAWFGLRVYCVAVFMLPQQTPNTRGCTNPESVLSANRMSKGVRFRPPVAENVGIMRFQSHSFGRLRKCFGAFSLVWPSRALQYGLEFCCGSERSTQVIALTQTVRSTDHMPQHGACPLTHRIKNERRKE